MPRSNTAPYPGCGALRRRNTQCRRSCRERASALHLRLADPSDIRPARIGDELARLILGRDPRRAHVPRPLAIPGNRRPCRRRLQALLGRALLRTARIPECEVLRRIVRERVPRSLGNPPDNEFHKDRNPKTPAPHLIQEWIEHETWRENLNRILPQLVRPELCPQRLTDQVICWN